MVMGYQFCLAINFLILIKYNIFYETIFLHMIIIHWFRIKRKKKNPSFWGNGYPILPSDQFFLYLSLFFWTKVFLIFIKYFFVRQFIFI